jgi:hypothetical protein
MSAATVIVADYPMISQDMSYVPNLIPEKIESARVDK